MRITGLEIERFAGLRDVSIRDLPQGITVIHGSNESGKTSLMEFVRSGMFDAGRLKRYPRPDSNDGGRILLEMRDGDPLVLTRRHNRISNEDGGPVPAEIFNALDLKTYESIFAMGLENLMDHSSVTSDERIKGRFLTIAGTKNLLLFRRACEQELDGLMGKRASKDSKKPLERTISEMRELESEIRELQSSMDRHSSLVEERDSIRDRKDEVLGTRLELGRSRDDLKRAMEQGPNIFRMRALQEEIRRNAFAEPFPRNGLDEYERLNDDQEVVRTSIHDIDRQLKELRESMEHNRDELTRGLRTGIERMVHGMGAHETERMRLEDLRRRIRELESRQQQSSASLGWDGRDPLKAETGIRVEDLLDQTSDSVEQLRNRGMLIESQLFALKDPRRADGDESIQEGLEAVYRLQHHWSEVRKIEDRRLMMERSISSRDRSHLTIAFTLMSTGAYLGYIGQQLVGIPLLIGSAGILVWDLLMMRKNAPDEVNEDVPLLWESMHEEAAIIGSPLDLDDIDGYLEDSLSGLQRRMDERTVDVITQERIASLEAERAGVDASINELRSELSRRLEPMGYPSGMTAEGCRKAMAVINQMMERQAMLDGFLLDERRTSEEIDSFSLLVKGVSDELSIPFVDIPYNIRRIELTLEGADDRAEEHTRLMRRRKELSDELDCISERLTSLISVAGDVESFLRMGEAHSRLREERLSLEGLREGIITSLRGQGSLEELEAMVDSIDETEMRIRLDESERELGSVEELMAQLAERKGAIEKELEDLRGKEELTALSQQFEDRKSLMRGLVRRYAVVSLSLRALNQACDAFMREKEPRVIASANGYLNDMTDGRYRMTLDPDSMDVSIKDVRTGENKTDGLWSSGLGDQVHLSLRLAMAEEMGSHEGLPMILDDVLVRFDERRRAGAAKAISRYAEKDGGRQVLLFTCDRGVLETFRLLGDVAVLIDLDKSKEGRPGMLV